MHQLRNKVSELIQKYIQQEKIVSNAKTKSYSEAQRIFDEKQQKERKIEDLNKKTNDCNSKTDMMKRKLNDLENKQQQVRFILRVTYN